MLDDRVGPIGDVERPVWPQFYINRTEGDIGAAQQIGHLAGDISGPLLVDFKPHDAVRAKITRDLIALPVVGKLLAIDDLEPAELRVISRADALQLAAHPGIGEI